MESFMNRKKNGRAAVLMCLIVFCGGIACFSGCGLRPGPAETSGASDTAAAITSEAESAEKTSQVPVTLPRSTAEEASADPKASDESTPESISETDESTEPETGTTEDPMSLVTGVMYSMAESLNVRADESTDSEILGTFSENAEIPVIESLGSGWVKVVFEGQTGYLYGDYVTGDPDWKSKLAASYPYGYENGEAVTLQESWENAGFSALHTGAAVMYRASANRKNIVIGVNAGHGASGGWNYQTYSHPDMSPKITGGTNAAGAVMSTAVSSGMTFSDGTAESAVNLRVAQLLRDMLLAEGFDVLMVRDGEDVQLDNIARTVICNNAADCHIAIHFDGDGLTYDKGCFYMSVPDGLKYLDTVASVWERSESLGACLISGLRSSGNAIFDSGSMDQDLTQTSYSTVPSVDIELGNQSSDHSDAKLSQLAEGLLAGVKSYYGY